MSSAAICEKTTGAFESIAPTHSTASEVVSSIRRSYDEISNGAPFHRVEAVIKSTIPFRLDGFQNRCLSALVRSKSIVLTAPTGSGKTAVAEMAIALALCKRKRVFYTTPLKALSNQKFFDLKRRLGPAHVGLLTGDLNINSAAEVVVMTTEVFRNMLNKEESTATDDVFAVVLDEFHFMNSYPRGTVIEEIVIRTPRNVLLVALSATMPNAIDVRRWFDAVHGTTVLVQSNVRPVPLRFYFCDQTGFSPLFAPQYGRKGRVDVVSAEPNSKAKLHRNLVEREKPAQRRPSFQFLARRLQQRKMLPAVVFVFSRLGCNRAAHSVARNKDSFVTEEELREITANVEAFREETPSAVDEEQMALLMKGIACHHAGLLPLWKSLIETLFQNGLVKIVFATDTLAAGINMPARTAVISALDRHRGNSLTTSDALQMAGRAGRRGKDTVGHCIILDEEYKNRDEFSGEVSTVCRGPSAAVQLLTAGAEPLQSQFTPSYGLVLNLLKNYSMDDAKVLVEKSFESNVSRREQCWDYFKRLASLLRSMGFLDEKLKLTNLGSLCARINCENELQMSFVLLEMAKEKHLSARKLAAVIAATFEEKRTRGLGSVPKYLRLLGEKVLEICNKIHAAQGAHAVCMPLHYSSYNMIIVEEWTNDSEGSCLFGAGSYYIAPGDACGLLRRVLDILRQIPSLPEVGGKLEPVAKRALSLLSRPPVADDQTYAVNSAEL